MIRKIFVFILSVMTAAAVFSCAAAQGDEPPVFQVSGQFTESDLIQEADLKDAKTLNVTDGAEFVIDSAGVYVLSGSASEASVTIRAGKKDQVRLVLDGVRIVNESMSCVSVEKAGKVTVTTTESPNYLEVTGWFEGSGKAVIFSQADLTLNGRGTLDIRSSKDGVNVKGSLLITGGTYELTCSDAALQARDSIRMADGSVTVHDCQDGLHAEHNKNDTLGYIYIAGGSLSIACRDDAVHGNAVVQIDGGEVVLTGHEGIESTCVRLNGGSVRITASDDGINAGRKSAAWEPMVEINGGFLSITTTTAKCDAVDANGDIFIRGGTIEITSGRPFDCDALEWEGGTVTVNGREISPSEIERLIVR